MVLIFSQCEPYLKAAQPKPQNNIGDHLNCNQVFIAAGPKGQEKIENL